MQARKYRPTHSPYEESYQQEKQVTYQAYTPTSSTSEYLKEFLFFTNIVLFSILTVLAVYTYLALGVPTFWAFLLALVTGLMGLFFIQSTIRRKQRQATNPQPKKNGNS